jgi:serine/threonine protein kinase
MTVATARGKFGVGDEPIPGYVLLQTIGCGGYGEVWKASAPGDLVKAIKIIYGSIHDRCATRELKSLNRVKTVQHPFLLSIERIEVVDNRLLIVTEFAESCLKRRFQACAEQGLPGIPRRELLGYLADTADALDFIRDHFRLQHLDVKPENLLLNGGHIKVGDFGLIKDLEDTKVSLVAGLTPLYAPPELFDGRPDLHSDQYSLAIVYQEMLTGIPPFSGRTTAQLAAQHLKSPPNLAPLPLADQPVVAKALAKEPGRRYTGCRELVEALVEATSAKGASSKRLTENELEGAAGSNDSPNSAAAAVQALHVGKLEQLDEPPASESTSGLRSTLVIGLGGLGIRVLQELRGRMQLSFGRADDIPCLQLLAIDTDVAALSQACRTAGPKTLLDQQTLAVPLRPVSDYRPRSQALLTWLSRRWLFNIPRSLKTESIRPLGRLALVDHWRVVANRLRVAILAATSPESIAAAASQQLNFSPTTSPRIFVVASSNGGTGSGMAADLAYGVRGILSDLGLSADLLCGLLAHTTSRTPQGRDIALANSYVCLKEIEHYSTPGAGYPGDAAAGIPGRWTDHGVFSHLYFLRLPDDRATAPSDQGAGLIAEYLFRAAMTNAASYLDRARVNEVEKHGPSLARRQIRSFGIYSFGGMQDDVLGAQTDQYCRGLWRMLLNEPLVDTPAGRLTISAHVDPRQAPAPPAGDPRQAAKIRQQCEALVSQLDLNPDYWVELTRQVADQHLGGDASAFWQELASNFVFQADAAGAEDLQSPYWEDAFAEIDTRLGLVRSAVSSQTVSVSLADAFQRELAEPTRSRCQVVKRTLESLIDDPHEDLIEIQLLAQQLSRQIAWLRSLMEDEARAAAQGAESIKTEWFAPGRTVSRTSGNERQDVSAESITRLQAYMMHRVAQVRRRSTVASLLQMENAITDLLDRLRLSLSQLSGRYRERAWSNQEATSGPRDRSTSQVRELRRLWQRVRERCVENQSPLTRILLTNGRELDWLAREAEGIARRWVYAQAGNEANEGEQSPAGIQTRATQALAQALPPIASCGGAMRMLLCGPAGTERDAIASALRNQLNGPVVELDESQGPVVLCCELEQSPLRNVTGALIGSRNDLLDVASRLQTRTDVDWQFLQ